MIKQYRQELRTTGKDKEFTMFYIEEELTAAQELEIANIKLANEETLK